MTMTIPTVPELPAGYVVQAADLNNLAYACTFLLTKPIVRVRSVSLGTSLAVTPSRTNIPYDTVDFDPDGMWGGASFPAELIVQTPGWYKVRYGIVCTSTSATINAAVFSQTGPNNPAGPGVNSAFYWGSGSNGNTGGPHGAAGSGIWPFYLFQGDFLRVSACVASGETDALSTTAGDNSSYFSMEYVSIAQT